MYYLLDYLVFVMVLHLVFYFLFSTPTQARVPQRYARILRIPTFAATSADHSRTAPARTARAV